MNYVYRFVILINVSEHMPHSSCYSTVNSATIVMRFIYSESAMLCGVQSRFCFAITR